MKHPLLIIVFIFSIPLFANNSLNFDGIDDYCEALQAGPTGNSNRTVEFWMKSTNSISSQQVIVDWGDMSTGNRFTVNMINFGKIRIEVGGNGFNSVASVADGTWHHIAITHNATANPTTRIYIDGQMNASGSFTVPVQTSAVNGIILGRRNDGVNYFKGSLDEVRIWSSVRSANDIATFSGEELCSYPSDLVAYYKINEGLPNSSNSAFQQLKEEIVANDAGLFLFNLSGTTSNFVNGKATITNGINTTVNQNSYALIAADSTLKYQWFDCNQMITLTRDTNRLFIPSSNGSYAVSLQRGACYDTSNCIQILNVGIVEKTDLPEFNAIYDHYSSCISLTFNESQQFTQAQLYNLSGQEVLNMGIGNTKQMKIPVGEWKGLYVLSLLNYSGQRFTQKILIP